MTTFKCSISLVINMYDFYEMYAFIFVFYVRQKKKRTGSKFSNIYEGLKKLPNVFVIINEMYY